MMVSLIIHSYDGLVVVLRGHGDVGAIYDSERKAIPLTFLQDMVSFPQDLRFEGLPRIQWLSKS